MMRQARMDSMQGANEAFTYFVFNMRCGPVHGMVKDMGLGFSSKSWFPFYHLATLAETGNNVTARGLAICRQKRRDSNDKKWRRQKAPISFLAHFANANNAKNVGGVGAQFFGGSKSQKCSVII
jgi:hypothetical protein